MFNSKIIAIILALLSAPAFAQVPMTGAGKSGSLGVNNITLDGTGVNNISTSQTSMTVSITTTKANDFIVLCVQLNSTTVSGVSDVAGLTWTQIGSQTGTMACYRAFSSGTLTSDVITITFNSTSNFAVADVFALNGTQGAGALDTNGALPGTTTTTTPLNITTSNAYDFIFACYGLNSSTGSVGSGWILLLGGTNYSICEYKLVSATQSSLAASLTTGTIKNGIGHAVRSN